MTICASVLKNKREGKSRDYFLYDTAGALRLVSQILRIQYGLHGSCPLSSTSDTARVLRRTNLLHDITGGPQKAGRRGARHLIDAGITEDLFQMLYRGLSVHGQQICRKGKPLCSECEICKFCDYYRRKAMERSSKSSLKLADIFSGIGGISYGFHEEGFDIVLAVDNDPVAMHTYLLNNPWFDKERFICKDIRLVNESDIAKRVGDIKIHVLAAGVPCQGFSRVGVKTKPKLRKDNTPETDPRNRLFVEVIRFVDFLAPEIVFVENVPDMGGTEVSYVDLKGEVLGLMTDELEKRGYQIGTICLDASKFGVPQKRKRLFLIASKSSLGMNMTEDRLLRMSKEMGYDGTPRNLSDAIDDLPDLKPGEGNLVCKMPITGIRVGFYESFVKRKASILYNHIARKHNEDDLRIIRSLKVGETYAELLERNPKVIEGRSHAVYSKKSFKDKFYRLSYDKPCRTIVSHLAKDGNSFIHPRDNRSLTVREAARIQTFPDNFILAGARTHQFIHIGNAVLPLLAKVFARFFKEHLKERKHIG